MAKIALLIAVSEYESGLNPLPATIKDVEAMQRVLQNPEIGGFEVECLLNPDPLQMQTAIENLFLGSQRDDIVLLYFSGHGIKHDNGKLYFATKSTRKNEQGELSRASTVSADFVHDIINDNRSRSRRQVIILDCCFSGAFSPGTKGEDDISLNFEKVQLGGEGRAVLTSSTSTQYSFESVYTQYLVQGIETGEADENNDGFISVHELHQYVQRKVQEGKHEMKPQIQAVIKEGFNIMLTKAPIHNREDIYKGIVKSWIGDNGQISDTGRVALIEQQNRLEIEPDKATAIEEEVLKPHKDYLRKLDVYKTEFLRITQENNPTSEINHDELKRLQQELRLKNEDVDKINNRKISPIPPLKKIILYLPKINLLQYVVVGMIGIMIGYVFRQPPIANSCDKETYNLNDRISLGEKILLTQDKNPDKEAGVKAFLDGDCKTAIEKLNLYRKAEPTDPEALIYLNNAKARENRNRLKIAVSVPIGTEKGIAEEMLRGVAQAQNEVNNKGGINNKALLEVVIANDDNDAKIAPQIASDFVKDKSILAVVGHNSSRASKPASAVYQQSGLVMISPTSYAEDLTSSTTYIFRTAPGIETIAKSISDYAINKMKKTNFLICTDQNPDNISFKKNFDNLIGLRRVNPTKCEISVPTFDPNAVISEAKNSGADALVLAVYINKSRDTERRGRALVKANNFQLSLFSTSAVVTKESLEEGKDINGLITSLPWHSTAFPDNPFVKNANQLWKAPVNWRTATSYDATKAIILGLQKSSTRYELQQTLSDPKFSVDGATGQIQFSSGNRKVGYDPTFPIKVQQNSTTKKYEFVPIP
ncbi:MULTISPECIES: caspase family protein [Nostocales]|uniref:ABC transporter substrate-binding protein n=1 Tax=Dolichospermum flos-aquae UHCC 0037 TaxID=2590026 RepID=A0ACC7SC86_DOLFA|nr:MULTISPECIES: caspase family protein [Nostocales]MBO1063642.1 ABC transporter substrate-binding protein [Anabaena sp. 54]MTJ46133.1 ABC transporter substrate-binding protein [Dolichospermum flos-aquae UHCC 0037]